MKSTGLLLVLFGLLTGTGFAQSGGPYRSVGGFGNVVYPGTGHAPNATGGALPNVNAIVRGGGNRAYPVAPPRSDHPRHDRTVIVPYPVFYTGGYGYNPLAYEQPAPPPAPPPEANYSQAGPNGAPSVVINQNFLGVAPAEGSAQAQESGMRVYSGPSTPAPPPPPGVQPPNPQAPAYPPPPAAASAMRNADQPTLYLIAFKDRSGIVPALGYWVEGTDLHYVSVESTLNQVSLDLIDRSLSQRLNDERGVEFRLPPAR